MERASIERIPVGQTAKNAQPGDFILCHRKGFVSASIRLGEKIRFPAGAYWSHAAFVETPDTIIEALTKGVKRSPLAEYHDTPYALVHTHLEGEDQKQAVVFAQACLQKRYGFLTDLGIMLRFLTPGHGLWFGMSGTEICSGLVAEALTRGWAIFDQAPQTISPTELSQYYVDLAQKTSS